MSIKLNGELEVVPVASLIEIVCLRGKTVGIVFADEDGEGSLAIEDGRVVDARCGPDRGEAAVYRLLRWEKGSFRCVPLDRPASRTVVLPWRELVLEAMRQIDLDRRSDDIEDAFVALLSSLEQRQVQLRQLGTVRRSQRQARLLVELVNETLDFCDSTPAVGLEGHLLASVLATVARGRPAAAGFKADGGRLGVDDVVAHLRVRRNGSSGGRSAAILEVLLDVLHHYLDHVVHCFAERKLRELWSATCSQAMADLRGALDLPHALASQPTARSAVRRSSTPPRPPSPGGEERVSHSG